MNARIFKATLMVGILTLFIGLTGARADGLPPEADGFRHFVDRSGVIRLPDVDYRKNWTLLGSWAIASDDGASGSQGIHLVYTQPEAVAAYRKNGKFPDGTVLIKELISTVTADMTTGTVSRAGATTGWFVMVNDAKGRFPGNSLWGDGWGWAFFAADNRLTTTTKAYVDDCKGCHVPAQQDDWVYIQGYPVLSVK